MLTVRETKSVINSGELEKNAPKTGRILQGVWNRRDSKEEYKAIGSPICPTCWVFGYRGIVKYDEEVKQLYCVICAKYFKIISTKGSVNFQYYHNLQSSWRSSKGICTSCGKNETTRGYKMCVSCRGKTATRKAGQLKLRKDNQLCLDCGISINSKNIRCKMCLDIRRVRQANFITKLKNTPDTVIMLGTYNGNSSN